VKLARTRARFRYGARDAVARVARRAGRAETQCSPRISARDDHDRDTANAAAVVPRPPEGRVQVGERAHAACWPPSTVAFPGGGLEESDRLLPLFEAEGLPPGATFVYVFELPRTLHIKCMFHMLWA